MKFIENNFILSKFISNGVKLSFLKVFFVLSIIASPFFVDAATTDNLSGYAWSANVGWISFNCTNDSSCGTSNYGVNKDGSGYLTGYAWSSEIGWIQFGGLSGFPSGSGTTAQNAQVSGGNLIGWARSVANGDGWDGWIALTGTGYGVTQSGLPFSGYAWGGSVVGWVSFNCLNDSSCGTSNYSVTMSGSVSLSSSGTDSSPADGAYDFGTGVLLSYTLTSLPGGTVCNISKTSGTGSFTTLTGITTTSSQTVNSLVAGTYTLLIDCIYSGSSIASASTSFTVGTQPPGFMISGASTIPIQFVGSSGANSSVNTYFVDNGGTAFSNPVTISVTGISPSVPSPTVVTYSFNGGAFSASPTPVVISSPYSTGLSFAVHFNIATSVPYTVTLTGVGSGAPNATKNIVVTPVGFVPTFEEN